MLLQKSQKTSKKKKSFINNYTLHEMCSKKVNHNANIEERNKSLRRNHRIATTQTSYHRAKVAIAKLSEFIKSNCKASEH